MKLATLLLITILFGSYTQNSHAKLENEHYPILGDRSTTVGHMKTSFSPMPGGYATNSFLMNSLTLGLGDYFEIGILPWAHLSANQILDYTLATKLNFYKSKTFQVALGYSQIKLSMENSYKDVGISSQSRTDFWWNYSSLSVNLTPQNSRFNFGFTYKVAEIISKHSGSSKSSFGTLPFYMKETYYDPSWNFEANVQYDSTTWLGGSIGETKEVNSFTSVAEDIPKSKLALGLSMIKREKFGFINTPNLALIYFADGGITYTFSSTF